MCVGRCSGFAVIIRAYIAQLHNVQKLPEKCSPKPVNNYSSSELPGRDADAHGGTQKRIAGAHNWWRISKAPKATTTKKSRWSARNPRDNAGKNFLWKSWHLVYPPFHHPLPSPKRGKFTTNVK